MSEDTPPETPEQAEIPVAPPAHGPVGSPPTPPAWSYRAGGLPVDSGGAQPEKPAASPLARHRPSGAPPLPGPVRTSASSLGPAGRERAPFAVAVLSVVTLGLYALLWHRRINDEMSDFDPRMRVSAAASTFAVTIAWLLGLIVSLAGVARLLVDVFKVSLSFDPHFSATQAFFVLGGLVVVPYIVLVLPFSLVAVVMTLERIRVVEDRVGITADVQLQPARTVWLLIVPVIGGLMMIAAMQRRLNRVWEHAAPRPAGLGA